MIQETETENGEESEAVIGRAGDGRGAESRMESFGHILSRHCLSRPDSPVSCTWLLRFAAL